MKGWVYIITNKAMPGLVKIGYSDRDPENRAIELNSTASPHPHVVEFAVLVDEPKRVEKSIHFKLKQSHEAKEWFRCTIDSAKRAMISDQTNPVITHGTRYRQGPKLLPSRLKGSPKRQQGGLPVTELKPLLAPLPDVRCTKCRETKSGTDVYYTPDAICFECFDNTA